MKPIMTIAGISAGDFVDEAMEDELNNKDDQAEKETNVQAVGAKSCKTEEFVTGNSVCPDDKK